MNKNFRNFDPLHNNMLESPYARIIETVRKKCIILGEALQIGGQKHQQNLPENCSKTTKMAIRVREISKTLPGEHTPKPGPV